MKRMAHCNNLCCQNYKLQKPGKLTTVTFGAIYYKFFDDLNHFTGVLRSFIMQGLLLNFTASNIMHMEVLIDNTELDCELQEMYMISSHWKTDIGFVKDEIRFLNNTLDKYKTGAADVELTKLTQFQKIIDKEGIKLQDAETNIAEFLGELGPIVNHDKTEFGLDVLEKFNELETTIKSVTNYIILIRRLVFLFLEKEINAKKECSTLLTDTK
jgi:hypothetical protein